MSADVKKTVILLVALFLLVIFPNTALAEAQGDFTYTVQDGKATVTGYTGMGGDVTVPAVLGDTPVAAIGDEAFKNNDHIGSITVENGIESIGKGAFYDCDALRTVTLPQSIKSIGDCAFLYCEKLLSINLLQQLQSIGYESFGGCTSLTGLTLPESLKSIGGAAFGFCHKLTDINIPSGVESIGSNAFGGCVSLQNLSVSSENTHYTCVDGVLYDKQITKLMFYPITKRETFFTIPDTVTCIDRYAISNDYLTEITVPNSVRSVLEGAFSGCISLADIRLSNNLTDIGDYAFTDCTALLAVQIPENVQSIGQGAFENSGLKSIAIPANVTSIGEHAFAGCTGLTEISVPANVTSMGDGVFADCTGLTAATLAEGIADMGNAAFSGCAKLVSVNLPQSLTKIGDAAFSGCAALAKIVIPQHVATIGNDAFYECGKLADAALPDSLTAMGDGAFYKCTSLTEINIPDGVTAIGTSAFYCCIDLTDIHLPAGLKGIGADTFVCCRKLAGLNLPNGITYVGDRAFESCEGLTSLHLPAGVESIGESAFADCDALETVTLETGLKSIGKNAFYDCYTLKGLDLPQGVKTIGAYAFYNCAAAETITLPNTVTDIGKGAFYDCKKLNSVTIPEGITAIADELFYGCKNLTDIKLPDSVTSIGQYAFYNCGFTQFAFPGDINSIGDYAFQSSGLTSVTLPESLQNIGKDAFSYCWQLKDIGFSQSMTSISPELFCGCGALETVALPDNITVIGDGAFSSCEKLKNVVMPKVQVIGNYAFSDCDKLGNVTLPASMQKIGNDAFSYCRGLWCAYFLGQKPEFGSGVFESAFPEFYVCYPLNDETWNNYTDTQKKPFILLTLDSAEDIPAKTVYSTVTDGHIAAPTAPERAGFTVAGWYKDGALSLPWDFTRDTVQGNLTLYARWKADCTATFDACGGSAISPQTVHYGAKFTKPAPEKDGFTLEGWYLDKDYTKPYDFNTPAESDMTLYARWMGPCTVKFDLQGGFYDREPMTLPYGSLVPLPSTEPQKFGCDFMGWYREPEGITYWDFFKDSVTTDMTLYAKWLKYYAVDFKCWEGRELETQTIPEGKKVTKPQDPQRDGYVFEGWYKDESYQAPWNFDHDTVGAYCMLYAKWAHENNTVAFDTGTALAVQPQTIRYGDKAKRPDDPVKPGYNFSGWYLEGYDRPYDFNAKVTQGITLYAKWTEKGHSSISVKAGLPVGGTVTGAGKYENGTEALVTATPNAGYRFAGWNKDGKTVSEDAKYRFAVEKDCTLSAIFEKIGTPSVKAASASYTGISLSWNAVRGATGYRIWRSTKSGSGYQMIKTQSGTAFTDTGRETGKMYYYTVQATCASATATTTGAQSAAASAFPKPAAPAFVKAAKTGATSAKLTWGSVSGRTKYEVYRSTSSASGFSGVASTASESYTNSGLKKGKTYYYKVRAYRLVHGKKVYGSFTGVVSVKM